MVRIIEVTHLIHEEYNMKLRFSESEITYWADQYVEQTSAENMIIEQGLMDLRCEVQERGYLTKEELYRVAYWKTTRKSKIVKENSEEFVKEVTTKVFDATDDFEKLYDLTALRGIGEERASAILHLLDKDQYPILDIHAPWSCGLEWVQRTKYPFWQKYIHFCRDLAKRNSVDMRTLDRALYRFSKDNPDKESFENIHTSTEITWEDIREKLEELKGGNRFSPELKAYLLDICIIRGFHINSIAMLDIQTTISRLEFMMFFPLKRQILLKETVLSG